MEVYIMNNLNKVFLVTIVLLIISICFMSSAIFKMKASSSDLSHYSQEQTRVEYKLREFMDNKLNETNSSTETY